MSGNNFVPESLQVTARTVVNKNVNREDIYLLPLPTSIQGDCFTNCASDRMNKNAADHTNENISSNEYCNGNCNFFSFTEVYKFMDLNPAWSESAISKFGVNLLYEPKLHSSFAANAEWLDLPPRRQLIERYRELKSIDPNSLLHSQVEEEIEDLEIMLNTLRFHPRTGLGEIHEWVRRFVFHKYDCFWYRVRVQAGCMKSFVDEINKENLCIVMLPYGNVTEHSLFIPKDEGRRLECTFRYMLLVVKGTENGRFIDLLNRVKYPEKQRWQRYPLKNLWYHILNVESFVSHIEDISKISQNIYGKIRNIEVRKIIFNPVIPHAYHWLFLMVPMKSISEYIYKVFFYESKNKNCVILFDSQNFCIGEPIRNLENYICESGQPFVFWFKNEKLSVKKIQNFPSFKEYKNFVDWCISKRMNTLLNLNCIKLEENIDTKYDDDKDSCDECEMIHFLVNRCGSF